MVKKVVVESEEGLACSHVEEGNFVNKTLAVPTVKKSIKILNKASKEVAADRGFYSSKNETEIQGLKVKHVGLFGSFYGFK